MFAVISPGEIGGDTPPFGIEATLGRARGFTPDPFPDAPAAGSDPIVWWYAPGEYEAGALHHIVTTSAMVARHHDYADNYRLPNADLNVRLQVATGVDELEIRGNGDLAGSFSTSPDETLRVAPEFAGEVEFRVKAAPGEPASFTLVSGARRLVSKPVCALQSGESAELEPRPGGERPAHMDPEPAVEIRLELNRGLFEAPAEILARIVVDSHAEPTIVAGESQEEALSARGVDQENIQSLVARAPSSWASEHELALRYLLVDGPVAGVRAEATIHSVPRRGAFLCSDPELSRIWGTSAYTLRLCMRKLMVDGLKRDRMPWVGDQAISILANAHSFGDATIAYDSHLALGSPRNGYVNGISDYSLWWLIAADLLHRYFPRPTSVGLVGSVLGMLDALSQYANDRGLFCPATLPGFDTGNPGSVLIDWGYELPEGSISTALQMLWLWALDSAAAVLDRAGATAPPWFAGLRSRALTALHDLAWDHGRGDWRGFADGTSASDPYANFLAVAAGVSDPASQPSVVTAFERFRGRTPYLQTILLRALLTAGRRRDVLDQLRRDWGSQLSFGATSFWEEFPSPGTSPLAMYGRPYARSLSHAWAAGPAALLPETIFGLRLIEPGWAKFSVEPDLCGLEWASVVIPAPAGDIGLQLTRKSLSVQLPAGVTVVIGGVEVCGPQEREIEPPRQRV